MDERSAKSGEMVFAPRFRTQR